MSEAKRILFVDDDADLLESLARHARAWGLEVFTAHNALTALDIIERQTLDLVCLDVTMPTGNGLSLGEMVSPTAQARRLPLVVLTGLTDEATRKRSAKLGAHYLAKGNDTWPRLRTLLSKVLEVDRHETQALATRAPSITELVFEMLGASESFLDSSSLPSETVGDVENHTAQNPWVLCVEDDRDFSLALQLKFKRHGISVVRAFEGIEGIQVARTRPADAIILDYNLPNGRGDYVLRQLKANPLTDAIPVIVVSGQKRPGLEKEMLHLGAAKFFAKPVRFDALLEELQRHVAAAV